MAFSPENIAHVNALIGEHPLLRELEQRILRENEAQQQRMAEIIQGAQQTMGEMQEQMKEIMQKADVNYTQTQTILEKQGKDNASSEAKISDMSSGITGVVDVFNKEQIVMREWVTQRRGEVQQQRNEGRENGVPPITPGLHSVLLEQQDRG